MTINIGLNLKKYVLIAADTRITYYNHFFPLLHFFKDDENKIKRTKLGLITGAGRVDILHMVEQGLTTLDIKNTEEMLEFIKATIKTLPEYIKKKDIEMTGWFLTYQAMEKENPVIRCAIIHPTYDYKLYIIPENKGAVIAPIEANENVAEIINQCINENIKPIDDLSQLNDSIAYNCSWIQGMLETLSKDFKSICSSYSIGVHLVDGKIGISDIIRDGKLSLNIN
jgi:hypothetical protein